MCSYLPFPQCRRHTYPLPWRRSIETLVFCEGRKWQGARITCSIGDRAFSSDHPYGALNRAAFPTRGGMNRVWDLRFY